MKKKLVSKLLTMCVVLGAIVMLSNTAAKAADTFVSEEVLAEYYLRKACEWGLIESQTLEEFQPSKPATYQFCIDLLYSATVLKEKGGFPQVKNHAYKKQNSWLKECYYNAALAKPETAYELLVGFTQGKKRSPKKSDKVTFSWLCTAATVAKYGELQDETWDEGLKNLQKEVNDRWCDLGKGKKLTRIEALDIVVCLLTDISINISEIADQLIGPPLPPPEEEGLLGTAIMMTDDYEVYEDGVFIGIYDPATGTITNIGEPAPKPQP